MKKFILIGLLFLSIDAISQHKRTKQAIAVADSILKSAIGNKVFNYFILSEGSYFNFNKHGQRTGKFLSKKRLPRSFTTLNFLYHFNYPEMDGVRGAIWLILDQDLKQTNTLSFNFIPQFLRNSNPPNFISIDSASVIAKTNFIEIGFEITTPKLFYNDNLKRYTYTVFNKLTKILNQAGKESGEMEIIEINAVNGQLEKVYKGYYGIIIR